MTLPEYVLWALPKGETDRLHERVMTATPDRERITAIQTLAARDGWHGFRIQVIDGELPDFAGALNV